MTDLSHDELTNDLIRLPTSVCDELWMSLPSDAIGTGTARHLVTALPGEGLGLWTQLFGAGETAVDGLRDACHYFPIIADPRREALELIEDGGMTIVRHATLAEYEPHIQAVLQEFVVSLVLNHLRRATGRWIVPVRAQFAHGAPRSRVELLDTRNLDFDADANAITFLTTDLAAALPDPRPGLGAVLRQYADLAMSTATPAPTWHDRFRDELGKALRDNDVSLSAVAAMLAIAPRTLQRRLAEHGTTWRAEVDSLRRETTARLLHDSDLTTHSVAARIGYSDARSLRRAARRWHGYPPL